MNEQVVDYQVVEDTDGKTYELIHGHTPELAEKIAEGYKRGKLLAWEKAYQHGEKVELFKILDVKSIGVESLKTLNIWDKLPEEVRKRVEGVAVEITEVEKKSQGRRPKYEGIPRELVCVGCKEVVKVSPFVLSGKLEDKGIALEDYVKDFHCSKCRPGVRGKKANPEFAKYGKTMKCSCGTEVVLNPTYLKAKAEKLGTTMEELIKNFKCQVCCPSKKGRPKKS